MPLLVKKKPANKNPLESKCKFPCEREMLNRIEALKHSQNTMPEDNNSDDKDN